MDKQMTSNVKHIIVLLVLVVALLVVLVYTGILGCNIIPGGCEAYYSILKGGAPTLLIAYGEGGMGNHVKLSEVLSNREILGGKIRTMKIGRLSEGTINDYDLIIVENAKKICTSELKMFQEYVTKGGRLIWTGDAGTELCEGDVLLLESERIEGGKKITMGPWARRDGGKQVLFDEFLGVSYFGNYCDLTECTLGEEVGRIEITNDEHKLTKGLSPSIVFTQDFSVVELNKEGTVRLVAVLDYGADFIGTSNGKRINYGKNLPFIASSQIGERVAYYATPIEAFMQEEKPYKALIEQMYYGMLYN